MKLIKINEEQYLVIDNNYEPKIGDWIYHILTGDLGEFEPELTVDKKWWYKVLYSTQPIVPNNCCILKEGITKYNKGCSERNRCLAVPIIPLNEALKIDNYEN